MGISLSGVGGDVGIGFVVGFITGYALKKILKIVLVLLGMYVLSLLWLQYKGVISINTDKLFNLTGNVSTQAVSAAEKLLGILPGTSAFAIGAYIGFKKG